jgi:hypothetical protein
MSPAETREDRLEARRKKMPQGLADLHWHLEDELVWLHLDWKEYKTLYTTNERRRRRAPLGLHGSEASAAPAEDADDDLVADGAWAQEETTVNGAIGHLDEGTVFGDLA